MQQVKLNFTELPFNEMLSRSKEFFELMKKRRTVRRFSEKEVPEEIILNCIAAAGRAPNGANLQPWFFAVVKDKALKKTIREKAEEIEKDFYSRKAPDEWLEKLAPLGTDANKEFIEKAPYLIVVFERKYEILPDGKKGKLYYTKESVGLTAGILITALHHSGLATLTYTPENMIFLNEILKRPANEKPFLVLVTGFPEKDVTVPAITKKDLSEISKIY